MFNNDDLDIIQEDAKKKKNKPIVKKKPLPEIKNENNKVDEHSNGSSLFPIAIITILLAAGIVGFLAISSKTAHLNEADKNSNSNYTLSSTEDSGTIPKNLEDHESDNSVPHTSAETFNTYANGFNVSLSRTISTDLKKSVFKHFSDLQDADLFESACENGSIEEYCKQRMDEGSIVTYVRCEIENEYDKESLERNLENYKDVPANAFYAGAIVNGDGYILYLVFEN